MKGKQIIYLLIALLLPGCIFVFLKFFGKNRFAVEPLFQAEAPVPIAGCPPVIIPYQIPESIHREINATNDSLVVVVFGTLSSEGKSQLARVHESFGGESIHDVQLSDQESANSLWRSCIFFLKEPFNLVLVDNHRKIRGHYNIDDREDIDRLLTEITIILGKY